MGEFYTGLFSEVSLLASIRPLRQASALVLTEPAFLGFAGGLFDPTNVTNDDGPRVMGDREVRDFPGHPGGRCSATTTSRRRWLASTQRCTDATAVNPSYTEPSSSAEPRRRCCVGA